MLNASTLLAMVGQTPQVVTETLYALHARGERLPDRLVLITTAVGKARLSEALERHGERIAPLIGEDGQLQRFAESIGARAWFDALMLRIVVPEDAAGAPLADISDADSSERMRECIFREIAAACEAPERIVHVSIAGGRKTMSLYAGQALSLFGRPFDRLTHVLVDPAHENRPAYFFPTPGDGSVVSLHEVEFNRLRAHLDPQLRRELPNYRDAIRRAQTHLTPTLDVDVDAGCIRCDGTPVKLAPSRLGLALAAAEAHLRAHQSGASELIPSLQEELDEAWIQRLLYAEARATLDELLNDKPSPRLLAAIERVYGKNPDGTRRFTAGTSGQFVQERRTRLNQNLIDRLGPERAKRFQLSTYGRAAFPADLRVRVVDAGPRLSNTATAAESRRMCEYIDRHFPAVPEARGLVEMIRKGLQIG